MITLLIEIWLTIAAWRKGWRGYAVLPLAGMLVCSLLIGLAISASNGRTEQAVVPGMLLDLACIGALIRLAAKAPAVAMEPVTSGGESAAGHTADRPAKGGRMVA